MTAFTRFYDVKNYLVNISVPTGCLSSKVYGFHVVMINYMNDCKSNKTESCRNKLTAGNAMQPIPQNITDLYIANSQKSYQVTASVSK